MLEAPTVHEATSLAELMQHGFSPRGAQHFAAMERRHAQGEFPELAGRLKHLKFVAWLIDNGRLTDALPESAAAVVPARNAA